MLPSTKAVFAVVSAGCAAWAPCAAAADQDASQMQRASNGGLTELSWNDAEEQFRATLLPEQPRAGEPFKLAAHLHSFEGADYRGPLVIGLRAPDRRTTDVQTVAFDGGGWIASFTPDSAGVYELDVSFRSTHPKTLRAELEVRDARLPRALWWSVLALCGLAALGYGTAAVLKRHKAPPPPPATP